MPSLLSVIIPTIDEESALEFLLKDLTAQLNVQLEIIVADGGSVDSTETVCKKYGAKFVSIPRGRGVQMNAAARLATGQWLLFLHADSRLHGNKLIFNALSAIESAVMLNNYEDSIAGHFTICFERTTSKNDFLYRYMESKSSLNRKGTNNGDQGLLLSHTFFQRLEGFSTFLPFLEDQQIAQKIKSAGRMLTLPGVIGTSARRFEVEGALRCYVVMGLMTTFFNTGEFGFFERSSKIYHEQKHATKQSISHYIVIIGRMMVEVWGVWGTITVYKAIGQHMSENMWQIFYITDVCIAGRNNKMMILNIYDKYLIKLFESRCLSTLLGAVALLLTLLMYWSIYLMAAARKRFK